MLLLLQDRGDPHVVDRSFNKVEFDAKFADEVPEFADLDSVPGVDGFSISVDPLYKVTLIFGVIFTFHKSVCSGFK